jgi:serine/threonine protein kinase
MELLEGTDLRSILNERGRFPPGRGAGDSRAGLLGACRRRTSWGIVHRDLKASNIFIANGGRQEGGEAARLRHRQAAASGCGEGGLTSSARGWGTSYTMAPEQIRGDGVDARTDIYALGVVLYHLLTGQYPFRAETMTEIERQHLEAPVPRPSQVAPVSPGPGRDRPALHGQGGRPSLPRRSKRSSRRCAVRWAARPPEAEVTAKGVAIFVEIKISDGADAESDETAGRRVRDPRRDRAEPPRRPE